MITRAIAFAIAGVTFAAARANALQQATVFSPGVISTGNVYRGAFEYFNRTTPDWSRTEHLISRWNRTNPGAPTIYDPITRWKTWRPDLYIWEGAPDPNGRHPICGCRSCAKAHGPSPRRSARP